MVKAKPQSFLTKKRRRDGGKGDFKRLKAKVGRKLKPANVTDTNFKTAQVRVADQRSLADKTTLVTRKRRDLQDLLSHIKHYDPARRKDALWGIRELYTTHGSSVTLQRSLGVLFKTILDRMVDTEKQVREALYTLLEVLLPFVKESASSVATTFVRRLVAYSGSAMTSMENGVRLDAVRYVKLLLEWNCAAIQRDEFVSQLIPSLTAVLSSISIVRSSSTLRDQSQAFSVEGNEIKKRLKKTTKANQRMLSVLSTIDLLLKNTNGKDTSVHSSDNSGGVGEHKNNNSTASNADARSSILQFLDVNEKLTYSSDELLHGRKENESFVLNFTSANRVQMFQDLIETMSTIWCDLHEMMGGDSSTTTSTASKTIIFESMSIVLNIVQSIHDILTSSSRERRDQNSSGFFNDDHPQNLFAIAMKSFRSLYGTIAGHFPILGSDERSRPLNVHLTHVLLRIATTVRENHDDDRTKPVENACYNYVCELLSNINVLNAMPRTTLGNVLSVVEFMVTNLEALELSCVGGRRKQNHNSKRNNEKQRRTQKKRAKVVMSALTQWYQSCTVEQERKLSMFHQMVLRLIQRPGLWWTHDPTDDTRCNIFITELKEWLSKYPQRMWQLTQHAKTNNDTAAEANNLVHAMLHIMRATAARSRDLVTETSINQMSFLFWMKVRHVPVWGPFSNGEFDESMQTTAIDLIYHLPQVTETLRCSLFHVLRSCQLSQALSSRLLCVLHHHESSNLELNGDQHITFLLDLVLGQQESKESEVSVGNGEGGTSGARGPGETGKTGAAVREGQQLKKEDVRLNLETSTSMHMAPVVRPAKVHMMNTVISLLSMSCTDVRALSLITIRVTALLAALTTVYHVEQEAESAMACLVMIRMFRLDIAEDVLSKLLKCAMVMSITAKSNVLLRETFYHLKQGNSILARTLEHLVSTNNGVQEDVISHQLQAIHEVVRALEDHVAGSLRSKDLNVFVDQIRRIKSTQTSYSGTANRIWSQLLRCGVTER